MSVIAPGRRPAFPPIGRLRSSPLSGGKKSGFASLNLTAMVDMFTILVIFLIQLFSASGQVTLNSRITVPRAETGAQLDEPGTVIMMNNDNLLLIDNQPVPSDQMGTELDVVIPGIEAMLKATREQNEKIFGRDPTKPYEGVLIVQADVKTDFRLVRRVIASANSAGWAKFKFVTVPKGSASTDAAKTE